ncbi:hypothetical protein [Pseudomonas bharatica]|uniref:hypothetical protein n=1 Tax=Pseudomonas bharatica TaxID=2692112 RepID=UPI003B289110
MTTADMSTEAEKIHAEIAKLMAETVKLSAETGKLAAESAKLAAESRKLTRETFWYPLAIASALVGSVAANTALTVKYLFT